MIELLELIYEELRNRPLSGPKIGVVTGDGEPVMTVDTAPLRG